MNISFKEIDFNLSKIKELMQPFKDLKFNYEIFGLAEDSGNPPVGIQYNMDVLDNFKFENRVLGFSLKEYNFNYKSTEELSDKIDFDHHNGDKVRIALRKDIRENIEECSRLLKDIIIKLEC